MGSAVATYASPPGALNSKGPAGSPLPSRGSSAPTPCSTVWKGTAFKRRVAATTTARGGPDRPPTLPTKAASPDIIFPSSSARASSIGKPAAITPFRTRSLPAPWTTGAAATRSRARYRETSRM